MRQAKNRNPAVARDQTFDAPVRGWLQSVNRGKVAPETATVLDNWFPEIDGIRARAGSVRFANIGSRVESMFSYEAGTTRRLFATDEGNIYDITAPADTETLVAASVTGQTNGKYSTAIMATAGGVFLTAVNGSDQRQLFDGANWSSPPITGVDSANLSHVWAYRNRLFFVEKDSLNAWYLGTESISGAVQQISLAGVFNKAGSILFGATWSIDAGDGLDDLCVFVSTNGEVAVYQGNNPSDVNAWSLRGVYDIGPPLGPDAFYYVGGDLLIATEDGLIPLSSATQKDRTSLSLTALSFNIERAWRQEVLKRHAFWRVTKWPEKNMVFVTFQQAGGSIQYQFVVNTRTNAWCQFTGWDMQSLALFDNQIYFGTADGRIMLAERGGADDGQPYIATYIGDYSHLGAPARTKVGRMAQGIFLSSLPFKPEMGIATDFKNQMGIAPSVVDSSRQSEWDNGLWDGATWDGEGAERVMTRWVSAFRYGQYIAPVVRVAFSDEISPKVQLIAFNLTYEYGERAQQ